MKTRHPLQSLILRALHFSFIAARKMRHDRPAHALSSSPIAKNIFENYLRARKQDDLGNGSDVGKKAHASIPFRFSGPRKPFDTFKHSENDDENVTNSSNDQSEAGRNKKICIQRGLYP